MKTQVTAEIKKRILELYPDEKSEVIAEMLGLKVWQVYKVANTAGVKKSEAFKKSEKSGRLVPGSTKGSNTRFKPGMKPWNTGKKIPVTEAFKRTMFKKGNKPHNTRKVGEEWVGSLGYVVVKLADNDIQFKHKLIWEQANGPIPKGMILRFKDNNKMNVELSNLEIISRKENMVKNSIMRYEPELRPIIKTIAKLKKKAHEKQDGRSKKSSLRSA